MIKVRTDERSRVLSYLDTNTINDIFIHDIFMTKNYRVTLHFVFDNIYSVSVHRENLN